MRSWMITAYTADMFSTWSCLRGHQFKSERKETTMSNEVIIKDTHRGLWYENGVLKQVLGAGRYEILSGHGFFSTGPKVELVLVDVRERELTIKGQEILTADKVAL